MLCYINSKFLKSDSHQSLFSNSCPEIRLKKLITAALNKLLLKFLKMNTDCKRTNPNDQLHMRQDKLLSHDGMLSYLLGKSRGPPGAITWAPRGNHVGHLGQSRGPPGESTWAPRGNHVGPQGKSREPPGEIKWAPWGNHVGP